MTELSKRYEFTGETRTLINGTVVKQIRRLKDGAIGGWIEKEENLSQNLEDDGWVFPSGVICADGVMRGGVMRGGEMWGGVMRGGEMRGGVMRGGVMRGPMDFIFVAGLKFTVSIQNNRIMSIGCETKSFDEWRAIEFDQQSDLSEVEFNTMRAILLPMLDAMELHIAATEATKPA